MRVSRYSQRIAERWRPANRKSGSRHRPPQSPAAFMRRRGAGAATPTNFRGSWAILEAHPSADVVRTLHLVFASMPTRPVCWLRSSRSRRYRDFAEHLALNPDAPSPACPAHRSAFTSVIAHWVEEFGLPRAGPRSRSPCVPSVQSKGLSKGVVAMGWVRLEGPVSLYDQGRRSRFGRRGSMRLWVGRLVRDGDQASTRLISWSPG
jgi:hypothetical protein